MYRYKYYYTDGTNEISGFKCKDIKDMYNDFDGLMDWDEFYNLDELNLSTHEVLELAIKCYTGFLKDFNRIEIIKDDTGEVIDFIEVK